MRAPLRAEELEGFLALVNEGLGECTENLRDNRFEETAPRKITVEIDLIPEKHDPSLIRVYFSKKTTFPKRLAKAALACLRGKQLLLESVPEEGELFRRDDDGKIHAIGGKEE